MRLGLLILSILLLVPCTARAADEDWNVYLNPSYINRMICVGDSLWCSTRGGVLLFDLTDSTFTHYIDGLGFRTNDVTSVVIDGQGSMWVGFATSGVNRIDDVDGIPFVQHYDATIQGLVSDSITSMVAVEEDVYYGSTNGVAKFFDNLPSHETNLTDSLLGKYVHDLLIAGDSLLWAAVEDGAALFNRRTLSYTFFPIGEVTSLCIHGGFVHCAGENGIQMFDGVGWSTVGSLPAVPLSVASGGGVLTCVTAAQAFTWDGGGWIDISGGTYTPGSIKYIFRMEYIIGFGDDVLRAVAVDAKGTPWVGAGLDGARRGTYITGRIGGVWRNKAPGLLSQSSVIELDIDDDGLWLSTRYYGIYLLSRQGDWVSYTDYRGDVGEAGLSWFYNHLALLYDSQGFLWANVLGLDLDRIDVNGLLDKGDDVWMHIALNQGAITSNRFVKAKEDPAGNRWFLSDDDQLEQDIWGINITNSDASEWLTVNPNIVSEMEGGSVFDCVFGSAGRVYLALRGHGVQVWYTGGFGWSTLSSLGGDRWETLIDPDDLASEEIWSIASNDTSVWIGTSAGLVRYRAGVIDSFTKKTSFGEKGLVGAIVYDLEYDGDGNLWVATDGGLNKIDRTDEIETFTTADQWEDFYPVSVISPLPSPVCYALAYDEVDNFLWIGTDDGLARLDLEPPEQEEISLSEMILYPNPVHISRGDGAVRIGRISSPVSVKVYNIEGELVHEDDGVSEGDVAWDLLTLKGYKARSGVYVVKVTDGVFTEMRKVAIIR